MHTILPPGTKWKAIGLGDLLEPIQVKKAYRKAMLVVHPDHTGGMDSEVKFICKRVFEAVNEAYDEFTKKESV
ncbi:J domain-containing protein [archaeon]|nr:MAG: J domain-containing protein [archaeon]